MFMLLSKYPEQSKIIRDNKYSLLFAKFSGNKKLLSFLNEKKYFIGKNTEATYRILNHWLKKGLIEESRNKGIGWSKFSLVDLVWQRIILELRTFGFPNEKILKVKDCLIDIKNNIREHYPILEFHIARAMQKNATFLVIYNDGFADLGIDKEIKLSEEIGMLDKNRILININQILGKIFGTEDFEPMLEIGNYLNPEEQKLIELINTKNIESVEVVLKNGKIDMLKNKEKIKIGKRLIDIMKESKYQTITVKMDGSNKPAYILRENKLKIKATE